MQILKTWIVDNPNSQFSSSHVCMYVFVCVFICLCVVRTENSLAKENFLANLVYRTRSATFIRNTKTGSNLRHTAVTAASRSASGAY